MCKRHKKHLVLGLLLSLLGPSLSYADDDFDFELEFGLKKKTTMASFPLQEIDSDALSDTAIEGALMVQSRSAEDDKPIHQKLNEEDGKDKESDVLSKAKLERTPEEETNKLSQILPAEPQFQPIIYQQPTGRTYTDHQTTTTFRP